MKVVITGATGMIGGIILQHCLHDASIKEVVSIGRRKTGVGSSKLKEALVSDMLNVDTYVNELADVDVAYFCIGVYTGAVPNDKFKEITVDYTQVFAEALKAQSPNAVFSFLSGAGADQKEKSKTAFARYKGMAENLLIKTNFKELYIFRPGYIYPVEKRVEPNMMYRISRFMYPVFKLFGKNMSIKSTQLGEAMFAVFRNKPTKVVLENRDIVDLVP